MTPTQDGADAAGYERLAKAYDKKLVGNINVFALDLNSEAIADAVARLALGHQWRLADPCGASGGAVVSATD